MSKLTIKGGVTFGELSVAVFKFFNELKREYKDDDRLDTEEILGCFADLFADLETESDDLLFQRIFGALSSICDLLAGLLGNKRGRLLISRIEEDITK